MNAPVDCDKITELDFVCCHKRATTALSLIHISTEKTLTMPVSKPCFGVGFKEEPLPADDLRTEALYDLVLSCIEMCIRDRACKQRYTNA